MILSDTKNLRPRSRSDKIKVAVSEDTHPHLPYALVSPSVHQGSNVNAILNLILAIQNFLLATIYY